MHELEKQIQNREIVYNNLMHGKRLEKELGEHIQKQFQNKQLELEYVLLTFTFTI